MDGLVLLLEAKDQGKDEGVPFVKPQLIENLVDLSGIDATTTVLVEDLEGLLGEKIFDWQWEWVIEVLIKKQKPNLRVNKEDLTTNRPDMIAVLTDAMKHAKIDHEAEERETP